MSRYDSTRLQELQNGLSLLEQEWGSACDIEVDEYCSHQRARTMVEGFQQDRLAKWADAVVDAFGLESFPIYANDLPILPCNQPHSTDSAQYLSEGLSDSDFAEGLTGAADLVHAGCRAILWCAAIERPGLLLEPGQDQWFHYATIRSRSKNWFAATISRSDGRLRTHSQMMRIVRLAFEDLVIQHELGRTEVSRRVELTDPIRLSASELAYLLFRDRSDSAKRRTRRMIQAGDIRAVTVGSGAGCKYEVSMQELILRILAGVPNKAESDSTED